MLCEAQGPKEDYEDDGEPLSSGKCVMSSQIP